MSGCPVDHGSKAPPASECPVSKEAGAAFAEAAGAEVRGANSELKYSQEPAPGQRMPLSTRRLTSTIPKGEDPGPKHQVADDPNWTYPSEQMFFNAMKRKGYSAREEDIPMVVAIHNTVNEMAWKKVLGWEHMHAEKCPNPRLAKFSGRPKDLSPKARLKTLFGYSRPFDRHDWVVDRCGTDVRYIIDFYNGKAEPGRPISMHLDARPALDSVGSFFDRVRRFWGFA